jgi:hypothetical protein
MARGDDRSVRHIPASRHHANTAREHPQRHPTKATSTPPVPAPQRATHRHHHHTVPSHSHWQTPLFHATAPPILFSILIAGLLVELRARLATPLPAAPPGFTVSAHADTALQRALIWAESRWPGPWALPVLCAVALGALRGGIWACAVLFDCFVEGVDVSRGARVRVGRWEDGGSLSGNELLAEMFT